MLTCERSLNKNLFFEETVLAGNTLRPSRWCVKYFFDYSAGKREGLERERLACRLPAERGKSFRAGNLLAMDVRSSPRLRAALHALGSKQDACAPGLLSLRMRLIVNFHQSIRRNVRVLLRSRKPDVSQQFLNRAQIGSGIQQVCGE